MLVGVPIVGFSQGFVPIMSYNYGHGFKDRVKECCKIEKVAALGVLETFDATSIIVAADEAAKTAVVDLIELRVAQGMAGKSYMMLTGDVSAVQAAIDRARERVSDDGMYLDSSVIANPDDQIRDRIL